MTLVAECPRCPVRLDEGRDGYVCHHHGRVSPLWRPEVAAYAAFGELLLASPRFPTYLPWPMSPGWRVSDFGVVAPEQGAATATITCSSGTSEQDGPVDVLLIAEEPGTGLGARCAGLPGPGPGHDVGRGPATTHLRADHHTVALWLTSTGGAAGDLDRSVLVGEAAGRWLWLVLRPASALLLLRDEWTLRDVSGLGPSLIELEFGGPAPGW